MENAQLISLSRQIALQRQLDIVANNMANINSTGFKATRLMFEDYMMPTAGDDSMQGLDSAMHYTMDWGAVQDMSRGSVEQTDNPLDVALMGEGFLTVQTPAGPRYMRGGSLQIDAAGILVDLNGNPVLGESGPLKFSDGETEIAIGRDGSVSSNAGNKGRLRVTEFADAQRMVREGDSYFDGPDAGARPAVETAVIQGAVERSNVSGVAELTNMIRVQRAYQSLAGLMQKQDDLRTAAIQRLGEVRA